MIRTLVAVLAAAIALSAVAADAAKAADGNAVFQAMCTTCHGANGLGTRVGWRLGAPNINALKDAKAIALVVTKGRNKMPAFEATASAEEIKAVAKFVAGGLK